MMTPQVRDLKALKFDARLYGDVIVGTKYDEDGYTEISWDLLHQVGKIRRLEAELDPDTRRIVEPRAIIFTSFQTLLNYAKEFTT